MNIFGMGQIVATPGVLRELAAHGVNEWDFLRRHAIGDWGELSEEDREANASALETGARLLSNYPLPDGTRIWIITEADRSATTLLLPEEY